MDTDRVKNFLSKFSYNSDQLTEKSLSNTSSNQANTFGETNNDFIKQFLLAPSELMDESTLQSTVDQSRAPGKDKILIEKNKKIGSSFEAVTLEKEELRHLFKTPTAESVILVPCDDHKHFEGLVNILHGTDKFHECGPITSGSVILSLRRQKEKLEEIDKNTMQLYQQLTNQINYCSS